MKILIVDDKQENSYLLESLLRGNGYETISAKNGAEALEFAKSESPDLIVSDILMPVMDGFAFCLECKKNDLLKKIPFIFYTATYTSLKDEEFALSLGADRFIQKPQDPDVFINIINEVLRDTKGDKIQHNLAPVISDDVVLKEYNSTLIRKLEDKMTQVEESEKELKKINEELKKQIELQKGTDRKIKFLAHALESISECISITDENDNLLFVNEAFQQTYGYSEEELIGKHISIIRTNTKESVKQREDISLITMNGGWKGEVVNRKKDGTLFPVFLSTSAIRDENNKTIALIGVATDISESKKAREELIAAKEEAEKSDKLKTEFLTQISHEIRTPMNVIANFAKVIKTEIENKSYDELPGLLDGIESSTQRIIRTIELILNMSEIQIGAYKPIWKIVDLTKDVLPEMQAEFSVKAEESKLKLNFNYKKKHALVYGDQYSMGQIFSHLLDNSIKYTERGKIDVTVDGTLDGRIFVIIEDTGIGMSDDFMNNLFEPFMQEERGYCRSYDGNGLGLALVKKYCDLNKIDISIQSEKGTGSRIVLNFSNK